MRLKRIGRPPAGPSTFRPSLRGIRSAAGMVPARRTRLQPLHMDDKFSQQKHHAMPLACCAIFSPIAVLVILDDDAIEIANHHAVRMNLMNSRGFWCCCFVPGLLQSCI